MRARALRCLAGAMLCQLAVLAHAAGGGMELQPAEVDLEDTASLQRGAKLFVNYCVSCHSASYMRYKRIGTDLDIPDDMVEENLMFTTDKIGETMNVAMRPEDAEDWFGVAPPDLSVIARSRGPDWLNTFLLTFYEDRERPTGVNNLAFPQTAMPHVLWELQGIQRPVVESASDGHGGQDEEIVGFETAVPGELSEKEYRQAVGDLVNFLVYLAEPAKLVRYRVGFWVILFLLGFLVLAYVLKKEYWRDVH